MLLTQQMLLHTLSHVQDRGRIRISKKLHYYIGTSALGVVRTVTKISLNVQHLAKPAINVVGAITLYLYVARFLIGEVHSDLNHKEDQTSVNELNQK